jgi:hypothetical protein
LVATATAGAASFAAPARADDNAEARVYFERGNRALTRGMNARGARRTRLIEEALAAYVQSLSIVRSRNVVYNAGVALEALGRDEEAFAYYREYLGYSDLSEEERREATQKLNALRARVAVLMVTSTPEGAQVRIDRQDLAPVGVTPLEVAIGEGDHTVYITAEGYSTKEAEIQGTIGQRENVSVSLRAEPIALVIRAPGAAALTLDGRTVAANSEIQVTPGDHEIRYGTAEPIRVTIRPGEGRRTVDVEAPQESSAPAGPPGLLAISVNVPATVYVDDEVVETGREVEASVASGPRSVRVEAEGYATATQRVDIDADGQTRISVHLEEDVSDSSRFGKWPGVFLAVGGFTAIAAAGVGIAAVTQMPDYEDDPTIAKADHIESLNLAADITFGIGAAIAATGLILAIINGDEEQTPSRIDVAAAPIRGGGVVVAQGSWGAP